MREVHTSMSPLLTCVLCLQLARRGFAIVLISRSQEKLDDVSKAIGELCEYLFYLFKHAV